MIEDKMLMKIVGYKEDKVRRVLPKFHKHDLHDMKSTVYIIGTIKSRPE